MSNDYNSIVVNQELFTIDDAREAATQLFNAQVDDFYALKNEKWYKHLLNAITFGAGRKKKVIKDIRSLSKLQTIFMRVYCENYKGLDKQLNEIIENLSKTNESVKRLYVNYIVGVRSQQSILDLSQLEQEILLLLLCAYQSVNGNDDALKKFRLGVAKTIGREIPQGEFRPDMLEQISAGEVFYRLIVEMCAVDGGLDDFSMPDNIYEAIDYLNISNNTKKNVENLVRTELDNFGSDYLVSKYVVTDDDLLDDDLELSDEDAIDEEFSTIIIDKEVIIPSGNNQVYKNKEIFVHAKIICDGELTFENCTIIYNDNALAAEIKIAESGQLTISGSTIKCMSYKGEYFCECNGNVVVKKSKFVDCAYLFMARRNLSIEGSEFLNCARGVINVRTYENAKVSICNNVFRQNNLKRFYRDDLSRLRETAMITVSAMNSLSTNLRFNNNVIRESNECNAFFKNGKFVYVESDDMVVTQSSFFNTTCTVSAQVSECFFYNSKHVINQYRSVYADNCIFEKCEDIISCGEESKITNCQFVSCKNSLIDGSSAYGGGVLVENCSFKNITNDCGYKSSLSFIRNGRWDSKENRVHKCLFDGISINNMFLIDVDGYEKPYDETSVEICDCTFRNCETKRKSKKLISEYISYYGVFNKEKSVYCTKIRNCTGIDKINSEGCTASNTSINFTSTYGRKIGAENS